VRVLDTSGYDEAQHTFALKADSPYAGNAYVVRISCVYQYNIKIYMYTHTSTHTHTHTCTYTYAYPHSRGPPFPKTTWDGFCTKLVLLGGAEVVD
jgi:carbohydrate-binding DOMON domain-containing protein